MAEKETKLNQNQKRFLEIYLANPMKGMAQTAYDLGMSEQTIYNWRYENKNGFRDVLDKALQERWERMKERASDIMFELAEEKDFRAVKYVLDYSGFGAPQKVEVETKGGITINIMDDANE